ncbi:hypothetical protein [Ruania zhangjianzhongii]|uniref:hypothetical protein n=1 Tax=Ruania zhangjianzhongii TaxID=2603206 RepID=UPI0011CA156C|nr:hypothetical protein [Ruania zhangjianzhongii]
MELSRRTLILGAGAAGAALTLGVPAARATGRRSRITEVDPGTVVIVAPEQAEWHALAEDLANRLAEATGVAPPQVHAPQQDRFASGWEGDVILLGNLGNNFELARLYGMRFAMVDSWMPGPGGHWVCTVVDPFGAGGNSLVVGASDLDGARAGIDLVIGAVEEQTVPRLHQASLADSVLEVLPNGGATDADYLAAERAALQARLDALVPSTGNEADAKSLHRILSELRGAGEAHLLTADAGFAELYHLLITGYADFVLAHPAEATDQLNERANMWTDGEELISVWAMMETVDLFSDAEREKALEAIQLTFAANANDGYLNSAEPEAPRWNHEAYPALSLVAGASYFQRHHDLPEAQDWHALGDRIFQGSTSVISLDEGADYLMHLPIITMDYAMLTGQYEFLTRTLRPSADLHVLMIDNGGSMVGGGDVYPYGYSGVYSWGHSQVMHAASWLFPEPIYGLLLERARTGPFSNNRNSDLANPLHRYQVDADSDEGDDGDLSLPAVMAYPVEEGVYSHVTEERPTEVDLERTFHKMAFRAGLDVDDPTLMVDGFAGGRHNHQDSNAIIGYTARSRILLTDRDYMENTPEHHSGLVVVRDGEQPVKPEFAAIDWVADVDGASVSRSRLVGWNGTDWTRTIFTADGGFHLVLDELDVTESGSYLVKNQWQTLGAGEVDGARYRCRQDGVTMVIDSMDASVQSTVDRYGHFVKYYRSDNAYEYAEAETVLSQVYDEQARSAGDRLSFVNVIATGSGDDDPAVASRRWNERLWQVTVDGAPWWFINGPVDSGVLSTDAALSVLGPDRITLSGAKRVTIGTSSYTFDEPVVWHLDTTTKRWAAYPVRRDHVHYDEVGEPIRPGPVDEGSLTWSSGSTARVVGAVRAAERPWRPGERGLPVGAEIPSGWSLLGQVAGTVTEMTEIPATGSAPALLLSGTADGQVSAVSLDGTPQWTAAVQGRVNEITHHVHDQDELIVVATEDYRVHALNRDGTQRWVCAIPDDPGRRERKGNLLGITAVRTGYVNGQDRAPSLMVGTQFRWVYTVDFAGEIQNEMMLYYYGIEDAVFADLDGDGVDEGAFALEYFNTSIWDDNVEHRGASAEGPGFTSVGVHLSDEAAPLVVYGTKQSLVSAVTYSGDRPDPVWEYNVGGQVNDLRCGIFHDSVGAEIVLGTSGFHVWSLDVEGAPRFRTPIGDRVLQVIPLPGEGYLALADHGLLVRLDTDGAETGRWRFSEPIVGAAVTGTLTVVLRDGTMLALG